MKKFQKYISFALVFFILAACNPVNAYDVIYSPKVNLPGLELAIDDSAVLKHGSIVFEAEDILGENALAVSVEDEKASGGKAAYLQTIEWNLEDVPDDDIYANVYLGEGESEGVYKIWIRSRANRSENASYFFDRNMGSYPIIYTSTTLDGQYRWTSSNIELKSNHDNYFAIKRRGSGYIDKIIITNDLSFKPSGKDDVPVYMTPEEQNDYFLSLYPEPEIKPVQGHPRLYLTPDFIPEFKQKIASDEAMTKLYDKYKAYAYEDINCKLDTTKANNHNATLLVKILGRALVWVLGDETDINHAKATIGHITDYLTTVRTPDDASDITRSRGNYLLTAAVVYDWLYNAMSESEKNILMELIMDAVKSKELGWPPTGMSSISSHAGEYEIFRDMLGAGVAIYDEYPTLYEVAAGRMFAEMVPARNWLRPTGRIDFGNDYGECRSYSELWADMTIQRMGYESIYKAGSDTMRWFIRSRMSYGSMMPSGDMYSLTRKNFEQYYMNYPLAICIAGNLYNDPYLKAEFERRKAINGGTINAIDDFFTLIFTDPAVPTQTWDEWELSRYTSYPLSSVMARTSWQEGYNSDNAMAFMNMHEGYMGDHQNMYTGDFQLYYRGLLAMNTGTYNASTEHNEAYKKRAWAGNVMLCNDPDETFVSTWSNIAMQNDSGQRNPYLTEDGKTKGAYVMKMDEYNLDENGVIQNRELVVADDVKHYIGPDKQTPEYSYIGGNLTNAYSDKVTDYHRNMVFLDLFNDEYPAALIVFDKMSSADKSFKKTWLLHCEEAPAVEGNKAVITRVQNGFDGKLVNQTMLPERYDASINVVGGNNNEMYTLGTKTYTPKADAVEAGKYRIELSPRTEKKDDIFLNGMYVTSASANLPELPMFKEQGAGYVGVTVRDRFVTFAKDAELICDSLTISVRNNGFGEVSVLLTDMSEGVWTVTGDGKTVNVESKAGENCVYFKGAPGTYKLVKATEETAADIITSTQTPKRAIGDFFIWKASETTTSNGYGSFVYLKYPTILNEGTSYVLARLVLRYLWEMRVLQYMPTVVHWFITKSIKHGLLMVKPML